MSTHKKSLFRGVGTALITPFRRGKLDLCAAEALIKRQAEANVSSLVICGTTGEAPTLTADEKNAMISLAASTLRSAGKNIPVIAGVTSNDTGKNVTMAKAAEFSGADAVMVAPPYYNKPTPEGIIRHFYTVADAVSIPLIAYNVPSRVGVGMTHDICTSLSKHENIIGLKEASGDLSLSSECLADREFSLSVYSGCDELTLPMLSVGASGVISVAANIFPDMMCRLCESFFSGKKDEALRIHRTLFPLFRALFTVSNPIPVKSLSYSLGLCENELRPPLFPLEAADAEKLTEIYRMISSQR